MDKDFKDVTSLLQYAVWQNNLAEVRRLVENKSSLELQDRESGWTPLHRALYFGHLRAAVLLLDSGAPTTLLDFKGREPLDIVSGVLDRRSCQDGVGQNVYSWGSGTNYQLGTGAVSRQEAPARVEGLVSAKVISVAAAKFHSAALSADGKLYTWGHGRGGRLGHLGFDIHSGETAVIAPSLINVGRRPVAGVAAAKHHMLAVTIDGNVFTWGSNRDGRLGYLGVDTQPTPRRIGSIRQRMVAVAAANRHSACLTDSGQLYTWGSNLHGQLGYGTYTSASNAVPRLVDALKDRQLVAISAAKRHTVALTHSGELFTWGHRQVAPRRVNLPGTRDVVRPLPGDMGMQRVTDVIPRIVMVAAGAAHTSCITDRGVVLAWRSADPQAVAREVGGLLTGKQAVHISAGKYRTAVVTVDGDVYMWEGWSKAVDSSANFKAHGKAKSFETIEPERVEGLKRVTAAAVGEKHSLCLQCWQIPCLDSEGYPAVAEVDARDEFHHDHAHVVPSDGAVPSLQRLCEAVVAHRLVEPRTASQIFEFADAAGAHMLRAYCKEVVLQNLELILLEACSALEQLAEHLLEELEATLINRLARPTIACSTPTAPLVPITPAAALAVGSTPSPMFDNPAHTSLFQNEREVDEAAAGARLMRQLQKKLQQVEMLEARQSGGQVLDMQQMIKIQQRPALQAAAAMLAAGRSPQEVSAMLDAKRASSSPLDGTSSAPASECDSILRDSGGRKVRRRRSGRAAKSDTGVTSRDISPNGRDAPEANTLGSRSSSATRSDPAVTVPQAAPSGSSTALFPAGPMPSASLHDGPHCGTTPPASASGSGPSAKFVSQSGPGTSSSGKKTAGKAVRKGGLSMFLAGDLEKPLASSAAAAPAGPATPVPSWRVATGAMPRVSLLNIQSEEAAMAGTPLRQVQASRPLQRTLAHGATPAASPSPSPLSGGPSPEPRLQVAIADLVSSKRSAPIPLVRQTEGQPISAWGGASPPAQTGHHSLRMIQAEQEESHVAGGSWGKSPGSHHASQIFRHMSSWRERRTAVNAAGSSPAGGMAALGGLGSSPAGRSFVPMRDMQHTG